ncbi:bacteriocin [Staphylococcus hominis]|uniref:bacteriocin n=1 Tax=Staphylococcus hominis TaxID=1290 RepID=UPI001F256F28|nr:bacteriocin [Staphylococcus hominis]UJB22126.1 bacteriocin [Staphylococcus hominis]
MIKLNNNELKKINGGGTDVIWRAIGRGAGGAMNEFDQHPTACNLPGVDSACIVKGFYDGVKGNS